jgi:hypothetical protein
MWTWSLPCGRPALRYAVTVGSVACPGLLMWNIITVLANNCAIPSFWNVHLPLIKAVVAAHLLLLPTAETSRPQP